MGLQEWGKGYWKINNSVLLNDDYIALIKNLISDFEKIIPKDMLHLISGGKLLNVLLEGKLLSTVPY